MFLRIENFFYFFNDYTYTFSLKLKLFFIINIIKFNILLYTIVKHRYWETFFMRKNIILPICMLFVLALTGCNKNTSQPLTSSEGNDSTTSSETSSGNTSSAAPVEASIEVSSNVSNTPNVDFQDTKYYVGEMVRFKVVTNLYNVDSVTANDNVLTKGEGEYPYNFIALESNSIYLTLSIQYASKPTTKTLTFNTGNDRLNDQIYNFWTENSGVNYDIATKSTAYKITYKLSIDTHLIDDEGNNITGLGYGSKDEIQINLPMYFWTANPSEKSFGFNMRLFKYDAVWVYRPLYGAPANFVWSGTRAFEDHRDDALARNIVKYLSRGGVEFTYEFNEANVTAKARFNNTDYNIGTCSSLTIWNGQDNGNQQLRYIDLAGQFSTTLANDVKLKAENFIVDYTPAA